MFWIDILPILIYAPNHGIKNRNIAILKINVRNKAIPPRISPVFAARFPGNLFAAIFLWAMIPQIIAAKAKTETIPRKLTIPIDSTRNPSTIDARKATRLPMPRYIEAVAKPRSRLSLGTCFSLIFIHRRITLVYLPEAVCSHSCILNLLYHIQDHFIRQFSLLPR